MNPKENQIILDILAQIKRSPLQSNRPFDSDAEIVNFNGKQLSITVDTLSEEISLGLFRDWRTIGWLSVIMSLSDLAATGATPLGILTSLCLPFNENNNILPPLLQGINECLESHETFLLGGDTNDFKSTILTTTALGVVSQTAIRRSNHQPGDQLYFVGAVGIGNLVALANLSQHPQALNIEKLYRPQLNFKWVAEISQYVTSAIDTSDGLLSTIEVWIRHSQKGFFLDEKRFPYFPMALKILNEVQVPRLALACGTVGDYGLLLTVNPVNEKAFLNLCSQFNVQAQQIGHCIESNDVILEMNDRKISISLEQLSELSNLYSVSDVLNWIKLL